MGNIDVINNIPSCLITGKRCINGTGIVSLEFDDEYKNNQDNKFSIEKKRTISSKEVDQKEILGGCFASGNFVDDSAEQDDTEEESEALGATQTIKLGLGKNTSKRAKSLLKKQKQQEEEIEDIDIPDIDIDEGNQDESFLDL